MNISRLIDVLQGSHHAGAITLPAQLPTAEITDLVTADRDARPGSVFVALQGGHVHGLRFAAKAVEAGAIAVLAEGRPKDPSEINHHSASSNDVSSHVCACTLGDVAQALSVPVVFVEHLAPFVGELASLVWGDPAASLRSFAVTGTNGKTTTAYILSALLRALGKAHGMIGTVEVAINGRAIEASLTTPMPADLQRIFAHMREEGCSDVVMEVSSHALAQGRTTPVVYDVSGFTNLTQDHLDFHATLEEYFRAKAALFTPEKSRSCVILTDTSAGLRMYHKAYERFSKAGKAGKVFALARQASQLAELSASGWLLTDTPERTGTRIHLDRYVAGAPAGERIGFFSNLIGEFNALNMGLALAMIAASGQDLTALYSTCEGGLGERQLSLDVTVPGRMEEIRPPAGEDSQASAPRYPRVLVDFAHNTDALTRALAAARRPDGRLIALSGAAGDRDKGKRPAMGAALAAGADVVVICDDDPHSEAPEVIRASVRGGAEEYIRAREGTPDFFAPQVVDIADRAEAIAWAVAHAEPEDTVLLAGRGHEKIQECGEEKRHLDDREEARKALTRWIVDHGIPLKE